MKLTVVLQPSEEGGYTAYVPSLPGCISEGASNDVAMRNIREAIELYLEPVEDTARIRRSRKSPYEQGADSRR